MTVAASFLSMGAVLYTFFFIAVGALQQPSNNNRPHSLHDGDRKLMPRTPVAFSAIPWTYLLHVFFVAL